MTNEELEKRLHSLEKQVVNLATRTGKRANSNEDRISNNETDLSQVSNSLSGGVWNKTTVYDVGDYVMSNNVLYICLIKHKGIPTSDTNYWEASNVANELNKLKKIITAKENNT